MKYEQSKADHPEIEVVEINLSNATYYNFKEKGNESSGLTVPASLITEVQE